MKQKLKNTFRIRDRIAIIHTEEVILGTDEPVRAVRRKKNASMVLTAKEVSEGRADACISAGNTGALMAAGLFIIGRIEGIERPALSPTFPTINGEGFVLLDVGANADAKPEHLVQYALMGSIYSEKVRGIQKSKSRFVKYWYRRKKGKRTDKTYIRLIEKCRTFTLLEMLRPVIFLTVLQMLLLQMGLQGIWC